MSRFMAPFAPSSYIPPSMGTDEEEQIDPKALYTCVDQVWDQFLYNNWKTTRLEPTAERKDNNGRLIFKAYKRVYGPLGPSIDDHTWIELTSEALTEFLRAEESLKGADGLSQTTPGIDARDLFLRLPQLKGLAVEPTARDEARSHNDTAAVHSIEIKIAATMRSLGDAYPDEKSKREWREKADAYEQGNDAEKEHIPMPLAKGLGILIATPFAVAGGAIFAAGAIVYGAGKTVEGLGNTLTGGAFQ
ncbi:hypothetical protein BDV93DRAFT_606615 [Ceratobasidium sp. AG-I]|nr:hypothetical protein BDV93DRAFT_606615 [Ceratobasidium sp. AG-I]